MGTNKTKLSITLDSDLAEVIRIQSSREDRSTSQYINRILKRYALTYLRTLYCKDAE